MANDISYPLAKDQARELATAALAMCEPFSIRESNRGALWAKSSSFSSEPQAAVIAIGAFDGVHVGHKALIRDAMQEASERDLPCVVVTFAPDPMDLIAPGIPSTRLLECTDRVQHLLCEGVDAVVSLTFDEELLHTNYEDFMLKVLPEFVRPVSVHVGSDFRLGHGRDGNLNSLVELGKQQGFSVHGMDLVDAGGEVISATRIRELLKAGELCDANKLLGRCHFVRGVIEHGRGEGTGFGFPTANVSCVIETCMPKEGVYACYLVVDGVAWPAATNVGAPPSFSDPKPAFLEANLIGFEGDIYGKSVEVIFVERLRDSKKFDSFDELYATVMDNINWTRENLGSEGVSLVV